MLHFATVTSYKIEYEHKYIDYTIFIIPNNIKILELLFDNLLNVQNK